MSLFKEQLNERNNTDQRLLENSFDEIAGVVLGSRPIIRNEDKRDVAKNAIDEILQFFELRPLDIPESFVGISDLTEYYQQAYGMMYREVELKDSWYLDAFGPILAFTKDNQTPGIMWSAIGSIEIVKDVHIVVSDGEARIVTLIPSDVEAGMIVRIAGEEYLVSKTEEDEFGIKTGLAYVELPDGQYPGKIVTGEIKLIRYILGDR